ncbi:hypothetical protein [Kitasatospora sp. GAS1066B]
MENGLGGQESDPEESVLKSQVQGAYESDGAGLSAGGVGVLAR